MGTIFAETVTYVGACNSHVVITFVFFQYPWSPIRSFIDAFNHTREEKIKPSRFLVVDECMSAWRGLDGKYSADGLPHVTKIRRKPEGVGAELKSVCCGQSVWCASPS